VVTAPAAVLAAVIDNVDELRGTVPFDPTTGAAPAAAAGDGVEAVAPTGMVLDAAVFKPRASEKEVPSLVGSPWGDVPISDRFRVAVAASRLLKNANNDEACAL